MVSVYRLPPSQVVNVPLRSLATALEPFADAMAGAGIACPELARFRLAVQVRTQRLVVVYVYACGNLYTMFCPGVWALLGTAHP